MINPNIFLTMAENQMESPSFFPFSMPLHIGFCVLALAFFILRFVTDKKPYQLILAVAIPLSLTLWISSSRTWYYILGLIELILIITAFVSSVISKRKGKSEEVQTVGEEQE
ncbi:MAG: hypothetical protein NC340_05045 [Ruminococcus flavefaciens]|nr:hypothetical protein [Ruminococcus flavefaciens]MCM1228968.1 hypothetical protein [Ruminococcus flavefaciens]